MKIYAADRQPEFTQLDLEILSLARKIFFRYRAGAGAGVRGPAGIPSPSAFSHML